MSETRTEQIGLRVTPSQLADIDARAAARGCNRTEFMVGAALGTLDVDPADTDERLSHVEERLTRLEGLAERAG